MRPCRVVDLGLIPYGEACRLQQRLVAARKADAVSDVLLLCEHPHVITLGRSGKDEHLLAGRHLLEQMGVEFHATDRGGDITYHGPGQVVGYPILKLSEIRRDVVWYVRQLEEAMIRATFDFGIAARREPGLTGVWLDPPGRLPEKLAAIGVHISRWITSHGFAYNASTDLRYFDLIVPCGISGRKPISLEKVLGRSVAPREAADRIVERFGEVFKLQMLRMERPQLEAEIAAFEESAVTAGA